MDDNQSPVPIGTTETTTTNEACSHSDSALWQYCCRGCGKKLPLGFGGLFHRACLKLDKRRRTRLKRRLDEQWFEELLRQRLERLNCPNCGAGFGNWYLGLGQVPKGHGEASQAPQKPRGKKIETIIPRES